MTSSRQYRDALSQFPTGVTLVTVLDDGVAKGLTVNSFASVSLHPPLILWSLARDSLRFEAFADTKGFAVNVLAADQRELSEKCARDDRLERLDISWEAAPSGRPYITGCVARFDCSVEAVHEGGDHIIIVGRVEHFDQPRDTDALVFHRSGYMKVQE